MATSAPLQAATLHSLMAELGEDFTWVLDTYLDKMPTRLAAIREALASHDMEQLCNAAHSLKGSSLQFGADQLAELCQQIENTGKNGQTPELPSLVGAVLQEASQVQEFLEHLDQPGVAQRG